MTRAALACLVAAAATLIPLAVTAGQSLMPHPAPQRRMQRPAWSAQDECVRCHASHAMRWRKSRHASAATNSAFVAALNREPVAEHEFCLTCHAPEREPRGPSSGAAMTQGVSCVSCHLSADGAVLASATASASKQQVSPHPLRRSPQFATADACQKCHEFEFPQPRDALRDPRFALMQRTWSEHADGNFGGASCASCHMPRQAQQHDHAFPGGYNEQMVRRAVKSSATFNTAGELQLELSTSSVTHAVPTGDLFRRLRVQMQLWDGARLVQSCEHFLARHFEANDRGQRVEVSDTRLHLTRQHLSCGPPAQPVPQGLRGSYRIVYERVAQLPIGREDQARLESSFVVHEGELGWAPARSHLK